MAEPSPAEKIVALAKEIVKDKQKQSQWKDAILPASTEVLIEVTAMLTSDEDHMPANIKALREAVISEIERKNSEKIIQTMKHLDASANRMSTMSILLAVIGTLLGVIQILKEFHIL